MGYLTERQKILINSLSPADRLQLADYVEYASSMADPKINKGGRLPEGNLANLFNRQNPRVQHAIRAMDSIIETPRFEPFQRKFSEAERLQELGMPVESGLTLKAVSDGLFVGSELQRRMKTDADLPRKPPTLRDHISRAAERELPKAKAMNAADFDVAVAGSMANLPLKKVIEVSSDTISESRGYDHDSDLVVAKGNDGDLRDTIENAVIDNWVERGMP